MKENKLLSALIEHTKNGQLKWQDGFGDEHYRVIVGEYMITLSNQPPAPMSVYATMVSERSAIPIFIIERDELIGHLYGLIRTDKEALGEKACSEIIATLNNKTTV